MGDFAHFSVPIVWDNLAEICRMDLNMVKNVKGAERSQ